MNKEQTPQRITLREEARRAKMRIKSGFWTDCETEQAKHLQQARELGVNESKAGRYFLQKINDKISGVKDDEFYLKVKQMLLEEGEVSDAIGRLTDKEYYNRLSYEEKQRYNLSISEKYLRALERFKREYEFESL